MKHPAIEQTKTIFPWPLAWWPFAVEDEIGKRQVQILVLMFAVLLTAMALDRVWPIYLRWVLLGGLTAAAVFNRFAYYRIASMVIVLSIWSTPYLGFTNSPFELQYRLVSSFMWQTVAIFLSSVLFERRALTFLIVANFLIMLFIPFVFADLTFAEMRVALEFVGITSLIFWIVTYQRDLRQAERQKRLVQSEEKFYKAFQNTSVGVAIRHLADELFIDVNAAFADMLGYEKEAIIGKAPRDFDFWVDQKGEREQALAIYSQLGRLVETEIRFRHRNGDILTGLLSLEPVEIGRYHVF